MNVIESYEYIYENENYLKTIFGVDKKDLYSCLENIQNLIMWSDESVYSGVMNNINLILNDEPVVDASAYLGYDEKNEKVILYINILALLIEFQEESYLADLPFLKGCTFDEYISFIFLHEMGHVVHALFLIHWEIGLENKIKEYMRLTTQEYEILNAKQKLYTEIDIKKMYRQIKFEKEADAFAKKFYKISKRDK